MSAVGLRTVFSLRRLRSIGFFDYFLTFRRAGDRQLVTHSRIANPTLHLYRF